MTPKMTQPQTRRIKSKRYSIKDSFATYKHKKRDGWRYLKNGYSGKNYVKKEDASEGRLALTYEKYNTVIKDVFAEAWKDVLEGAHVEVPSLGVIGLHRWKVKRKIVDFHATRQAHGEWNKLHPEDKRVIYVNNINTQGWGAMTYWDRPAAPRDLSLYKFVFVRNRKQELSKYIKENPSNIYNYEIIT